MKHCLIFFIIFIIIGLFFQPLAKANDPVGKSREDSVPTLKPASTDGFQPPRIRRDWTNALNSEDLSPGAGQKSSYGDITGATFSYSHNDDTSTNAWTAIGALLLPYTKHFDLHYGTQTPALIIIAPSVTINKVSGSTATNEVDHLDYRLGFYSKWLPQREGLTCLLLRGALVYGTDTGHHASLPAVEIEIEPQLWWNKLGLGYRNVILPKVPAKEDGSDNSWMDIQLRGWMHSEYGDLQRNGAKWDTVDGTFFRIGPTTELIINFPECLKGISINTSYAYLPALIGPTGHNTLFKAGCSITLYRDAMNKNRKISLKAEYTKGGLTLSNQDVNLFNIGIGLVF